MGGGPGGPRGPPPGMGNAPPPQGNNKIIKKLKFLGNYCISSILVTNCS